MTRYIGRHRASTDLSPSMIGQLLGKQEADRIIGQILAGRSAADINAESERQRILLRQRSATFRRIEQDATDSLADTGAVVDPEVARPIIRALQNVSTRPDPAAVTRALRTAKNLGLT